MRALLAGRLAEGEAMLERAYRIGLDIEEPDAEAVFQRAGVMVLADLTDRISAKTSTRPRPTTTSNEPINYAPSSRRSSRNCAALPASVGGAGPRPTTPSGHVWPFTGA
jgi:hypothetical protein